MTTITLPKDLEDWARAEVAAGRASGVGDLIAGIVRAHRETMDGHRALVAEAYRSLERGGGVEEAEADAIIDGWLAQDLAESR